MRIDLPAPPKRLRKAMQDPNVQKAITDLILHDKQSVVEIDGEEYVVRWSGDQPEERK